MSQNKKKGKSKFSSKVRQDIINLFSSNPNRLLNYKQVAGLLEISDKELRKVLFETLTQLASEDILKEVQRGKFKIMSEKQSYTGRFESIRRGSGYIVSPDFESDLYVDEKNTARAIHGDKVTFEVLSKKSRKGKEGKITGIIDQDKRLFVGTLDVQDHFTFLNLDDHKMNVDLFIQGKIDPSKNGFKAIAQIADWPESAKNPFGKIVEILGKAESNDVEMKSILTAYGIKYTFPDAVISEANQVSMNLDNEEVLKRRDFRDVLTFTIDPVDAKDFDDAISVEFLKEGHTRVGVHIADVAHYVTENSALDAEAKERGNSVYLVDRVIPMLPEHLSNGVCSLRPNEEKFAFSAVFDLDDQGAVQKEWFGKTVINSNRRFTYEEAQEVIETGKGDHFEAILKVDSMAKILRKKRMSDGALEIHGSEIRFELDDNGFPVQVHKKTQKEANKLVEEYMLLANRKVGEFVGDTKRKTSVPLIYRIHDKPDMEKVAQFSMFISKFGKTFSYKSEMDIAKNMNAIFEEFKGENEYAMIQQMAIKTMSKAVYETENIGHYGLGFRYYAHFTSPIRRYADLMVHRILLETIENRNKHHKGLAETANHISLTERKASEAERASKKFFQAVFLQDKEGEVFAGNITGLTDWGMYVELEENFCEGMISLKSLKDDHYNFDQDNYIVQGAKYGEKFNLGDRVHVRVSKVSVGRKQIDLELIE
jgi:ribonuclease R